jgi:hypothetical protein
LMAAHAAKGAEADVALADAIDHLGAARDLLGGESMEPRQPRAYYITLELTPRVGFDAEGSLPERAMRAEIMAAMDEIQVEARVLDEGDAPWFMGT